uniref:Endonuclease/exonuclease n=1 Tax=Pyxidicoccus sp. MCy9557 TaxID=2012863 RepID=A0A1Z2TJN0_9BACT|nr:endonuclease/exonuclease [Pyxidicoccus sp. MCy9557]
MGPPVRESDAGSIDGGWDVDPVSDAGTDAGSEPANLRIMAANLTSGDGQSYSAGHGIRLMRGPAPDVILVQEFNFGLNTEDDLRRMVEQVGEGFHYAREGDAQIPNGIISRWPILASGEWDDPVTRTRDFVWARIDIPGPRDLWAVSVHLLTTSADVRVEQARALLGYIAARVPEDDYLVIGGDLNTDTRDEPCFPLLQQAVVTAGPHPADTVGNTHTNAARNRPYDHVLVDADLREHQQATVIGTNTFPDGLVFDTRFYTPVSDVAPVLVGDSVARNMQHMPVVKDFRVPLD